MNIRVDLNYPIKDGTEVLFRSPVDCSQVTGLKVYYPGASHEFMFADAHGNNVGDIDHLFAENVVVKVILDVTTSMAFVQNADTNAYIERTFVMSVNLQIPDENGNVQIEAGGGGSTMIVTLDGFTASKDAGQIYNHVASGGNVILRISIGNDVWNYVNLSHADPYWSYFMEKNDDYVDYVYIINERATCRQVPLLPVNREHLEDNYYTKGQVDQKISSYMSPVLPTLQSHDESITALNGEVGDISSALASTVKSVNGQSPDEKGNVQVKTDKTLSLPNVPAEAAAVGIFFNRMSDRVADLEREPMVFFYCGYPYAAERGMDWDGWIESIYNTEGFFVDRYEDDEGTFYRYHVLDDGGDPIIRCRDGQHAEGASLIEPFGFYGSI